MRYKAFVTVHFGQFVRWTKARRDLTNVRFAELLGVSDKTVGNLFKYETHDRLDDVALSRMAKVLGFANEIELIEAYQAGLPNFAKPGKTPAIDGLLIAKPGTLVGGSPAGSSAPASKREPRRKSKRGQR